MKNSRLRYVILILIALTIVCIGIFYATNYSDKGVNQSENPSSNNPNTTLQTLPPTTDEPVRTKLSDEEIKELFRCRRQTDDNLLSDIYCQYPNLYRTGTITDEEILSYFGCDKPNQNRTADSLCVNQQKLNEYKADLLSKHLQLSN